MGKLLKDVVKLTLEIQKDETNNVEKYIKEIVILNMNEEDIRGTYLHDYIMENREYILFYKNITNYRLNNLVISLEKQKGLGKTSKERYEDKKENYLQLKEDLDKVTILIEKLEELGYITDGFYKYEKEKTERIRRDMPF